MKRSRSGDRFGSFCVPPFLLTKPWFFQALPNLVILLQQCIQVPGVDAETAEAAIARSLALLEGPCREAAARCEDRRLFEVLLPQPVLSLMYVR